MNLLFHIFLLLIPYHVTNGTKTTAPDNEFARPLKLQRMNTLYRVPPDENSQEIVEPFQHEQDEPNDAFETPESEIQEETPSSSLSSKTLSKKRSITRSDSQLKPELVKLCSIKEADIPQWKAYFDTLDCITFVDDEDAKECQHQVKPKISKKFQICGNGGTIYDFQYDICVPNPYFSLLPESEPDVTHTVVYSICFDEISRMPLYTEHSITSIELVPSLRPEEYIPKLQTNMYKFIENLDDIAEKYNQIIENNKDSEDYLIPQMLVPLTDTRSSFVREANFHYINIRLQYGRLIEPWNFMNELVWKNLHHYKAKSKVKIFTGVSEKLIIDEQEVPMVSLLWWKLIKINDKAVQTVLVLYNIPFKYQLRETDYLCSYEEGSCYNQGEYSFWGDINKLNKANGNIRVQCCPMTDEVLRRIGLPAFIRGIENPEVKELIDNIGDDVPRFLRRRSSKLREENLES